MIDLLRSLRAKLGALRTANSGNVTITFALATLPIIGFVGAAVDYSHANSVRTALQAAVDSTALMLSKEAANLSNSQINTKAFNYFMAMFNRPEATNIVVTPSYTNTNGSQMVVSASADVPTNFIGLMGYDHLTVSASSTAKWGNTRLRVALALDVTGSMADDGKLPAMKTAAKNLLNQLKSAATVNGDVYVSIVPFSKDVNVGGSNYNESWVKWSGGSDTWDENNGTCKNYSGHSQPTTKSACLNKSGTWTPDNHNTWNGCVTDRDQDYDENNTAPTTSVKATLFPAEQYSYCPAPLMALSYDWTSLASKIDSLSADGNTNQAIGLAWAFQSLTAAPFSIPTMDPKYKYNQVIILMTDGLNTENRWYTKQSSIDARQKALCDNIKAAGITLYTIQVNTGGDPTQSVLQYCASSSDKFFLLTSANQLITTFNTIGTALSNLRIAK
ncbi:MAG TPA: pilus assembly protein TadG-related protein [Pseudorhodoplanes sp.]|nr:pilus assembly protein TadG-related protein [Pseudorhodoplanes sp.]